MSPWHESVISKNYRSSSLGNINSPPNIQYDKKQRLSKMQSIGKKITNTIYFFNTLNIPNKRILLSYKIEIEYVVRKLFFCATYLN